MKSKQKYQSLSFEGPQFPEEYTQEIFELKGVPITKEAAEVFSLLSRWAESDYIREDTFRKNAWKALSFVLPSELASLSLADFEKELVSHKHNSDSIKARKKDLETKEERLSKKQANELKKQKYGFAQVDGEAVPIAGYLIEGPGFLITRGADPRKGEFKYRVKPQDVTVNIVNDPSKEKELKAQGFKVVSKPDVLWVFKYNVKTSGRHELAKKVNFAPSSSFGHTQELKKYEAGISLLNNWDKLQSHIEKSLNSTNEKTVQSAIIAHLIQKTAIRIGNERDLSQFADTVGASTLKAENMKIDGCNLTLNFLGKDSVPYKNTFEIDSKVATALSKILKETNPSDKVFGKADSSSVSALLKDVVANISPKTFRTAIGTSNIARVLSEMNVKPSDSLLTKKKALFEANLTVAKILNHQKNIGKNYTEQEDKAFEKIDSADGSLKEHKAKSLAKLKKIKKDMEVAKKIFSGDKLEEKLSKYKDQIEKIKLQTQKKEETLERAKFNLDMKKNTKEIATGTSLSSYCDPRVIVSWAKTVDYPINKIYTASLIKKMDWALDTNKNFWKNYPQIKNT